MLLDQLVRLRGETVPLVLQLLVQLQLMLVHLRLQLVLQAHQLLLVLPSHPLVSGHLLPQRRALLVLLDLTGHLQDSGRSPSEVELTWRIWSVTPELRKKTVELSTLQTEAVVPARRCELWQSGLGCGSTPCGVQQRAPAAAPSPVGRGRHRCCPDPEGRRTEFRGGLRLPK